MTQSIFKLTENVPLYESIKYFFPQQSPEKDIVYRNLTKAYLNQLKLGVIKLCKSKSNENIILYGSIIYFFLQEHPEIYFHTLSMS